MSKVFLLREIYRAKINVCKLVSFQFTKNQSGYYIYAAIMSTVTTVTYGVNMYFKKKYVGRMAW
jgi:hypothetical protein